MPNSNRIDLFEPSYRKPISYHHQTCLHFTFDLLKTRIFYFCCLLLFLYLFRAILQYFGRVKWNEHDEFGRQKKQRPTGNFSIDILDVNDIFYVP